MTLTTEETNTEATTSEDPSTGRTRGLPMAAVAAAILVVLAVPAFAQPAGHTPDAAAGAGPTIPEVTSSTTTAPTTTTTAAPDPAAEFAAWFDAQTPEAQLAFQLLAGSDDQRQAFARFITPPPPPPPPPAPPAPAPAPVAAPAPAPAPAPVAAPAPSGGPANAFLACVVRRESRGDYRAVNPSSGAGGAYQFLQTTWNNTVRNAGRGDLAGIHPSNASPADQDAMALHLYNWQGRSPWAYPASPC